MLTIQGRDEVTTMTNMAREQRQKYRRPLLVCLSLCVGGELLLFVVYGLVLFPEGSAANKLWWAVLCGIGMGATTGAFVDLLIVDRFEKGAAVMGTAGIFLVVTGIVCNVLCMELDRHFGYWGGPGHSVEFMLTGVVMSVLGGLLAGWLLFSERGAAVLDRAS
jgi:hypothetical protein